MRGAQLACVVCQEPGTTFRHFYEIGLIEVAKCLGFKADDNYCDSCYSMIEERHASIVRLDSVEKSPSVDTMDLGQTQTQSQPSASQQRRQSGRSTRPSEMPLPISPPRNSSTTSGASRSNSSSQVSSTFDDTIDRLVRKKPRFDKSEANAIASQSLSLGNVSSSQDVSAAAGRRSSQRPVAHDPGSDHPSDDSSLNELQITVPPMPKNRRVRPRPKQFATGRLELPSSVHTKVLPGDFPRVLAG